jgi:hypothetical protein
MEDYDGRDDAPPPDCFLLEEIQALLAFQQQRFTGVRYYIWHNQPEAGAMPHRFLYAVELLFDGNESLFLTSGEDSEAIRLATADNIAAVADKLRQLHGKPVLLSITATGQPLWRDVAGKQLQAIRLSRNEAGWYLNDAVLLDFGPQSILLRLTERGGLLAGNY